MSALTPPAQLWAALHTDPRGSWRLLRRVRAELPCETCVRHFDLFVRVFPPAFGEGWFAWTVQLHNNVNVRLGRPLWTLDQARRLWGR
jgi:hypothetical protein